MPRFVPADVTPGKLPLDRAELKGVIRFSSVLDANTAPDSSVDALRGTGAHKLVSRWGVFGSNKTKSGVFAAFANGSIAAGNSSGDLVDFTDDKIAVDYAAASGYVAGDESTDNGVTVAAALEYWRKEGIADYRGQINYIAGYAMLKPRNVDELLAAVRTTGWAGIGLTIYKRAISWYRNAGAAGFRDELPPVWNDEMRGGVAGRVFVPVVGVDEDGNLVTILWGRVQRVSPEYYAKRSDEAWAVFTYDFVANPSNPGIKTDALVRRIARKSVSEEGPKLVVKSGVVSSVVDGTETELPSTSKSKKGAKVDAGASDNASNVEPRKNVETASPSNADDAQTDATAPETQSVPEPAFSH